MSTHPSEAGGGYDPEMLRRQVEAMRGEMTEAEILADAAAEAAAIQEEDAAAAEAAAEESAEYYRNTDPRYWEV